jgi:hypothetical protein
MDNSTTLTPFGKAKDMISDHYNIYNSNGNKNDTKPLQLKHWELSKKHALIQLDAVSDELPDSYWETKAFYETVREEIIKLELYSPII